MLVCFVVSDSVLASIGHQTSLGWDRTYLQTLPRVLAPPVTGEWDLGHKHLVTTPLLLHHGAVFLVSSTKAHASQLLFQTK